MLFTRFQQVQKQEISVFFVDKTFAVQCSVSVIVNQVHMYVVIVIVRQHANCILCPLFGHTTLVHVHYFSFLSCFDIGEVPKSPGTCNYNLFSFCHSFSLSNNVHLHACKVLTRPISGRALAAGPQAGVSQGVRPPPPQDHGLTLIEWGISAATLYNKGLTWLGQVRCSGGAPSKKVHILKQRTWTKVVCPNSGQSIQLACYLTITFTTYICTRCTITATLH